MRTVFFHMALAFVITSVLISVLSAMPTRSLTFEQRWAPAANLRPSISDPRIRMLHKPLLDYPAQVRVMVA